MRIIACALASLFFFPFSASAYTFHVYSNASIQDSIDAASAGDSVVVHQGTYDESISLIDSITVCSAEDGLVTIDGGNSTQTVLASGVDNTTLGGNGRRFTIEGGDDYGVHFISSSNLIADDIDVKATDSHQDVAGVFFYYCSSSVQLIRSEVHGQDSLGIYVYFSDVGIEDYHVHGVADNGIRIDFWSEPDLEYVDIDTCSVGLNIQWADVTYDGG
jgi:hypothetical protein